MAADDGYDERTIFGFKMGRTLGSGGFGFVKEGTRGDQKYAIKVMTKNDGWGPLDIQSVQNEINIMKTFNHPNIIKILKHELNAQYPNKDGTFTPSVVIIMELAEACNLFDILYYTDGFDERVCRTYMQQIMSAIKCMHDAGIAHRDMKPQNTLLDSEMNFKICDFGLSKNQDENSIELMSTRVGTMSFQAPEVLMGKEYDERVDIFAIGVMFFLMITGGTPPFKCAVTDDTWFKYIAADAPARFWKKHKKSMKVFNGLSDTQGAQDLFLGMCAYQPDARLGANQVRNSEWMQSDDEIDPATLKSVMTQMVNEALDKKKSDPATQEEMSAKITRAVPTNVDEDALPDPVDEHEWTPGLTFYVDRPIVFFHLLQDTLRGTPYYFTDEEMVYSEENNEFTLTFMLTIQSGATFRLTVTAFRLKANPEECYITFDAVKDSKIDHVGQMWVVSNFIQKHIAKLGAPVLSAESREYTDAQIADLDNIDFGVVVAEN